MKTIIINDKKLEKIIEESKNNLKKHNGKNLKKLNQDEFLDFIMGIGQLLNVVDENGTIDMK